MKNNIYKSFLTGQEQGEPVELIRPLLYAAIQQEPDRWVDDTCLYVSELGRHPIHAMRRILSGEQKEFPDAVKLVMSNGTVFEDSTLAMMMKAGSFPIIHQMPLWNSTWRGYADFVIGHGTDTPIIVEHKGTNDAWWDYRASLPRSPDLCQLWLYGELYKGMFGIEPKLVLFYRSWKHTAEFHPVYQAQNHTVVCDGWIDDQKAKERRPETRYRELSPFLLRAEMEQLYAEADLGNDLPEDEDSWDYAEEATIRLSGDEVPF